MSICECGKSIRQCDGRLYRVCCQCGEPITACMGFTKVGDLLECVDKKRKVCEVRELCGICVELGRWNKRGRYEPFSVGELQARFRNR